MNIATLEWIDDPKGGGIYRRPEDIRLSNGSRVRLWHHMLRDHYLIYHFWPDDRGGSAHVFESWTDDIDMLTAQSILYHLISGGKLE